MVKFKKGILGSLSLVLMLSTLMVACSTKENGASPSSSTPASESPSASSAAPTATPDEKPVKIRVTLWDRANAPEGSNLDNNPIVKYVIEETKKVGLEVEFVSLPRAQESEKLNVWMASGEAPDVIITYSIDTIFKFAEQGGLWELDEFLAKYPDLVANNKKALDQAGMYKGKRYAIPALRANTYQGAHMKIRKDWLDTLGMPVPTTNEELYEVLKAFKEKDPGGVGKENVVPFAMPAINQGAKGFFFGPMFGFGINNDGPGNQFYAPDGNFKDGVFTSSVALEEGKEFFRWMNQLYKEGLISKEFVTDINSQQYIQQVHGGTAGFTDSNDAAITLNTFTRKSVPEATWVTVEPFKRADGTQRQPISGDYGMFVAVPKASKNPEAVIKYLDWMAKPENLQTVQSGIKDLHWKDDGGLRVQIDPEANKKDIWVSSSGDLALIQQGVAPYNREQLLKLAANSPEYPTPESKEEYADLMLANYASFQKFGVANVLIDAPRPVAQKSVVAIEKFLYEGVSKAIISPDYDKAYAELISGWEKVGGREYDQEITDALNAMK